MLGPYVGVLVHVRPWKSKTQDSVQAVVAPASAALTGRNTPGARRVTRVFPTDRWREIQHPEAGHDKGRSPHFEGWYVKLVSADRGVRLAVIPGLFRSDDGVSEAFVQVLDGATGRSWYRSYPASDYWAAPDRFTVQVGPNRFTAGGVELDVQPTKDCDLTLSGRVDFTSDLQPWPVTRRSPGAMGWYAYMPFMECYHGVVSFGHGLAGSLALDGAALELDGGRGYIEQDWGQAFPAGYVWMHSNHFTTPGVSLIGSVALIPWLRGRFRGLLIGLQTPDHGLQRFATYNGTRTDFLRIDDEHVDLQVRRRDGWTLRLSAQRVGGALLHAPIRSSMHRRVEETLDAQVRVNLRDSQGRVVLNDVGEVAGLEVHGTVDELMATADRKPRR